MVRMRLLTVWMDSRTLDIRGSGLLWILIDEARRGKALLPSHTCRKNTQPSWRAMVRRGGLRPSVGEPERKEVRWSAEKEAGRAGPSRTPDLQAFVLFTFAGRRAGVRIGTQVDCFGLAGHAQLDVVELHHT